MWYEIILGLVQDICMRYLNNLNSLNGSMFLKGENYIIIIQHFPLYNYTDKNVSKCKHIWKTNVLCHCSNVEKRIDRLNCKFLTTVGKLVKREEIQHFLQWSEWNEYFCLSRIVHIVTVCNKWNKSIFSSCLCVCLLANIGCRLTMLLCQKIYLQY